MMVRQSFGEQRCCGEYRCGPFDEVALLETMDGGCSDNFLSLDVAAAAGRVVPWGIRSRGKNAGENSMHLACHTAESLSRAWLILRK